jgi:hypothetical protein
MSNASNLRIITSVQRRRRLAVEEQISWVGRSSEPGMMVSISTRRVGVAPSELFTQKAIRTD